MVSRFTCTTDKFPVHVNCSSVHWLSHDLTVQYSISLSCFLLILDIPNQIKSESCDSKEQKPEVGCSTHGVREQATAQLEQKQSSTHTNARSSANSKVSASKPRKRTGCKLGAKKWVHECFHSQNNYFTVRCTIIISHYFDNVCLFRKENNARQNRKVTDYYPIRRSNRKTKAELKVCMKNAF